MAVKNEDINGAKLKAEFQKRGLKQTTVESALDLGSGTFSYAFSNNKLDKRAIRLLKYEFEIPPELYVIAHMSAEEIKSAPARTEIDYEKLELIIRRAVAAAMQDRGV